MIQIEPFEIGDFLLIQPEERYLSMMPRVWGLGVSMGELRGPWSWTCWSPYGQPVACLGILANGHAWGIMSSDMRRYMVEVFRGTKTILDAHAASVGPVTAYIDPEYPAAIRWAKLLGFKPGTDNQWHYDVSTISLQSSVPAPARS